MILNSPHTLSVVCSVEQLTTTFLSQLQSAAAIPSDLGEAELNVQRRSELRCRSAA